MDLSFVLFIELIKCFVIPFSLSVCIRSVVKSECYTKLNVFKIHIVYIVVCVTLCKYGTSCYAYC